MKQHVNIPQKTVMNIPSGIDVKKNLPVTAGPELLAGIAGELPLITARVGEAKTEDGVLTWISSGSPGKRGYTPVEVRISPAEGGTDITIHENLRGPASGIFISIVGGIGCCAGLMIGFGIARETGITWLSAAIPAASFLASWLYATRFYKDYVDRSLRLLETMLGRIETQLIPEDKPGE